MGKRLEKSRLALVGQGLLIVAAAALLAGGAFRYFPPLAAVAGGAADRLQAVGRELQAEQYPHVSVVAITEATLARLPYRSPIDRGLLADILAAIRDAGARAVAFDILFDQPTEAEKDLRLIQAIKAFPAPVVAAWADARSGMTDAQTAWLTEFFAASGAQRGGAGLVVDGDGVVRRHRPFDAEASVRALPAAAADLSETAETADTSVAIIDWLGPTTDGKAAFQILPAHSLPLMAQRPAILKRWLEGRIVLIGAALPQTDRHLTALAADPGQPATTPGLLVHAHILAQMLDGRSIQTPGPMAFWAILGLAALIGVAIGFSGVALWLQGLGVLAVLAAWTGAAIHLAQSHATIAPLGQPTLAFGIAFALAASFYGYRQRRAKAFIRNAFSRYVAPQLVDALTADPDQLQLGGERRVMSFIFTDIAGFTAMSERLPPARLNALLNAYLDGMSRIVLEHGGTLDKFIGDAVVALFGAPVRQTDDAARAFACATALDRFAEAFQERHRADGLGVTRIGVHRGEATVGNFGGDMRFDYTAMGDAMNTAARLEGANKAFGTRIAFSEALAAGLGVGPEGAPDPGLRRIGGVILKGRSTALEVFTLPEGLDSAALAAYHRALELMDNDMPKARAAMATLQSSLPTDPLIALHAARIAAGETGSAFELKEK